MIAILKLVEKLVKNYKTTCPFELASYLNIDIWFLPLPTEVKGYFYRTLKRSYIAINENEPFYIQRFTCCHELGHYFHDKGVGYYFIESKTLFNPGKHERRANRFAVTLLTYGDLLKSGESIHEYYLRNNIPLDIIGKI